MHSVTSNAVKTALLGYSSIIGTWESNYSNLLTKLGLTEQWINVACVNLNANIANYSSGVIRINTNGGPVFYAVLAKYNNDYWQAELMSYNRLEASIVRILKQGADTWYGIRFN